jgi:tyrosinase
MLICFQAFANTVCHIGPGTGSSDHCLSRAVDESLTAESNADFVNTCNSRTSYPDMENCAELGPHAYGHNGVGSVMADVSASPSDPIFFMHHLFVDRNFWVWQNSDDARKTSISGCIDANSPCTPLTLDTVITVQGLRPDVTVRDLINTVDGAMCYQYTY